MLDDAFAGDMSDEDWDHALGGWHVLVEDDDDDGRPIAHAAVVPRRLELGARVLDSGYVEAVGTAPDHQRRGLGRLAMVQIDTLLRRHFEVGALATGSHEFYEALGWERWRGLTYVRHGGELRRSPEEDDAIMVLRYGVSADVELDGPIVCDARPGDDW